MSTGPKRRMPARIITSPWPFPESVVKGRGVVQNVFVGQTALIPDDAMSAPTPPKSSVKVVRKVIVQATPKRR